MKLIEILVKHLKRWPDGVSQIEMHDDGDIFFDGNFAPDNFSIPQCTDGWRAELGADFSNAVTREEYEAALAASKEMLVNKPVAWDGQGLPPVGQVCDFYTILSGRWIPVRIEAVTKDGVAFTWMSDEMSYSGLDCVRIEHAQFRLSLSAEEVARIGIIDNFIKIMAGYIEGGLKPEIIRERLYEHLPLLPGVKVEAPDA